MNNSVLSMDILPLLVDIIIQPNMRPVSIQQHITIIDEGGGILNTHVSTSWVGKLFRRKAAFLTFVPFKAAVKVNLP